MLELRQMIPPLTLRLAGGRVVRAWDFKQKRALAVCFLHGDCAECAAFLDALRARSAELAEREAVALAVYPEAPARAAGDSPPAVLAGAEMSGRARAAYLGADGAARAGVFVADRYGELLARWTTGAEHRLPSAGEILSWLAQAQMACEECGAPHWPAD